METIVFQSYRRHDVPPWIARCLQSVEAWTRTQGWEYRFVGDELLDLVAPALRDKAGPYTQIVTDLGRLLMARRLLAAGTPRVVWLDADILVFDPAGLSISTMREFAFGREIWVQADAKGRLKAHRNIHNAICVFCAPNSMLDFYIHAATSILDRYEGQPVAQIIGPKFLSALGNIVGFPLIDAIGMLSPAVRDDLLAGGGPALDLFRREIETPQCALNLCASLADPQAMDRVVDILLTTTGRPLAPVD